MFLSNSRYFGVETIEAKDRQGRDVRAVQLRSLEEPEGLPHAVLQGDQLDVMSEIQYRDGTRYWHVADANTELEARRLVERPGRRIRFPEK